MRAKPSVGQENLGFPFRSNSHTLNSQFHRIRQPRVDPLPRAFRLRRLPHPKHLKGQRASQRQVSQLQNSVQLVLTGWDRNLLADRKEEELPFNHLFRPQPSSYAASPLIPDRLGRATKWLSSPSKRESSLFCVSRNSDSIASIGSARLGRRLGPPPTG